jgi:hypothetical protein
MRSVQFSAKVFELLELTVINRVIMMGFQTREPPAQWFTARCNSCHPTSLVNYSPKPAILRRYVLQDLSTRLQVIVR